MDCPLHRRLRVGLPAGLAQDQGIVRQCNDIGSAKGVGPYLQFLRTPDAKTGWNRVHLDLRPYPGDDPVAEAARLRTLGATAVDLGSSDVPWTVLADPEGNEFCLLAPG